MQHHVGIESQDRSLVVRRDDPGIGSPDEGSCVDSYFVRRVDEKPDEIVVGIVDHLSKLH